MSSKYKHPKSNPQLDELLQQIGKKLFQRRQLKGDKLLTVAKSVGASYSTISHIENGRYYSLSIDLVVKLSAYYNITLTELIAGQ